jgi:hypothetical protein
MILPLSCIVFNGRILTLKNFLIVRILTLLLNQRAIAERQQWGSCTHWRFRGEKQSFVNIVWTSN